MNKKSRKILHPGQEVMVYIDKNHNEQGTIVSFSERPECLFVKTRNGVYKTHKSRLSTI